MLLDSPLVRGGKVERSDTLFDSSPFDGNTSVTCLSHSPENHLLNKKSTVNIGVEACVPSNVEGSGDLRILNKILDVSNPQCLNVNRSVACHLPCVPINVPQTAAVKIQGEISCVSIPPHNNLGDPTV